ncbi:MAG: Tn3 family transposase [Actinomycetota bacterium]|nr:Tn3 family transposase [Actinomycetota bacterium]MDP9478515.1 Tn3 family transposase [Actinomycetota bacterium]MDP9485259.1 Tn3 family transposase [Actinomycetota bacterium]
MPTRELLTPAQRLRLDGLPVDLDDRLMARHHTLSDEELAAAGKRRTPAGRVGFAVQIALLRFPGRPSRPGERAPEKIMRYVASQLGEDPGEIGSYVGGAKAGAEGKAGRETTRREHLSEIYGLLGLRPFDGGAREELRAWLVGVAAMTDSGLALVEALLEEMRRRSIVVPALYAVERLAWEARREARSAVAEALVGGLSAGQLGVLDGLLVTAPDATRSALVWLRQPPGAPSPDNFLKVVEKLRFVRSLGLSAKTGRAVHHNRLSRLAAEGARMTPQNLSTLEEGRRRATLVAYLLEWAASLTDEALEMHDRMVGEALARAKKTRDENFKGRGKSVNEKVGLYAGVGKALIEARESGEDPYALIEEFVPWERFVESVAEAEDLALPAAFDFLDHLEDHRRRLRKYAPVLLESFEFGSSPPSAPLLGAVEVLKEMNAANKRKVPETAPTAFVKPRWEPHVFGEDGAIDRAQYEACVLSELKDGLRSGDVYVGGSNKFRDFEDYLLPREAWEGMRASGNPPVAVTPDLDAYLEERDELLHEELSKVSLLLPKGRLPGVGLENGELKVSRLKKDEPEGLDEFRRRLYSFLPRVRLTDLLVEVDSWCGFSERMTDLRTGRPCSDRELVYAAVLADGTNLGPTKMAEATDDPKVTYERLAWASDWHVREETYQKAIAEVVNAHYRLPFSQHWGRGDTSSSDGQVFFAGGPKDALSQPNAKYGRDRGVVFYTHVSDQYAPFYSRVINTTVRDATHVLDGLPYHQSDLNPREHHSDTQGYTDQIFGATHLLGYRFASRIRNIKRTKLFPMRKPSRYPHLAPLIGGRVNVKDISSSWDEVLRLAASIKTGTVTASLILKKLANYPRQNGLAKALREIGKIERTLFALSWYQDLDLRRRVNAGLNKREARNALARAVFFNRLGELRDRSYEDQQGRASGLALLCAAIALWNAVYLERAVAALRAQGEEVPGEYLRHLSPLEWEHVTLTGVYRWDLEDGAVTADGFRALRGL